MVGKRWLVASVPLALSLLLGGGAVLAASFVQLATVPVPGAPAGKPLSADISWYDPGSNQFYLGDRSTTGVDVFNGTTGQFVTTLGKGDFTGFHGHQGVAGPDGVLREGNLVWAGDGNSTVKVLNATTGALVATVNTGGQKRADELAYDPVDNEIIVGNSADAKPFVTFISASTYKVLGKIDYANAAAGGVEQPAYDATSGMFVMAVPQTTANPNGEVDEINPKTMKVVAVWPTPNCQPNGLAIGPNNEAILGCSLNKGLTIINVVNGQIAATVPNAGGVDEVWYDPSNNDYYAAGANYKTGGKASPELFVVSAATQKMVASIATAPHVHSVAVSSQNNEAFVPGPNAVIKLYGWSTGALPKTGSSPLVPILGGLMVLAGAAIGLRARRPRNAAI